MPGCSTFVLYICAKCSVRRFDLELLSVKQQRILAFINEFMLENPFPPTIRDIAHSCDITSTSVVDYNLRILEREGYIARKADVSRGIQLMKKPEISPETTRVVQVPVVGNIAAGEPLHVEAQTSYSDNIDVPAFLTNDKVDVFAAKVKGDSMIDALVADGDLVIMEPVDNPRNGDMVAAFLEDNNEVTLKHFYLQNGVVTLKPANPLMSPITVAAEKVAVRGRVVGVIRSMSNNVKYTGY